MDRLLCAVSDVAGSPEAADLDLDAIKHEAKLMGFIRAASAFIDRRGGRFLPVTETRRFDAPGVLTLWIDAVLSVTEITVDGALLPSTEYSLYPLNRHWDHGPYTSVQLASEARWLKRNNKIAITGQWGLYSEARSLGVTASIDATSTALTVSNGGIVSPGMVLIIDAEQMLVEETLNQSTLDQFTVTRGVNGTTAAAHTTADVFRQISPDDVWYLARQMAVLMFKKSQSGYAGKVGNAELGEVFYQNEFPSDPLKQIMRNYRIVQV